MGRQVGHGDGTAGVRAGIGAAIAIAIVLVLTGCAQGQPSVQRSTTGAMMPSPSLPAATPSAVRTTSPPTETATPSPAAAASSASSSPLTPQAFTSTHYRYRLTLPADSGAGAWVPAIRAWDGRQLLVRAGPYLDRTLLPEGGLFLVGTPTSSDVDGFTAEITALYVQRNRCAEPAGIRKVEINGVPARAFTQTCPEGLRPHRVVMVKDGYGILAFITANPAYQATALDLLIEILDGLEWVAPA